VKKELREELKRIILDYEAIRYVRIKKGDGFFLIRKMPRYYDDVVNYEDNGYGRLVADVYEGGEKEDSIIYHNCKLICGEEDIKSYALRYRINIDKSPEVLIDTILKEKKQARAELKMNSPKYITPIKDLFREIGLLPENRGKEKKKYRNLVRIRNKIIADTYKGYAKKGGDRRQFPIKEIESKLKAYYENKKALGESSDFVDRRKKIFGIDRIQIWRILKGCIKK